MGECRRRTKLFIIGDVDKSTNERCYFIPKNMQDAQIYVDYSNRTIENCKKVQKKCIKAVNEKWYLDVRKGKFLEKKKVRMIE